MLLGALVEEGAPLQGRLFVLKESRKDSWEKYRYLYKLSVLNFPGTEAFWYLLSQPAGWTSSWEVSLVQDL